MKITQYQVDAFAKKAFAGNPAAVCPLDAWLPDQIMQAIAAENNVAETAFFVKQDSGYAIRWFTPSVEVDLCGHATLASAYVAFEELAYAGDEIRFASKSGELVVFKRGDLLVMDFPAEVPQACATPVGIATALGLVDENSIEQCLFNQDFVIVLDSESAVINAEPDYSVLAELDTRGVIITARSEQYDFVNRFFGPRVGINEDPVTGSAYTKLIPFWAEALGKNTLIGKQVSARGGEVFCENKSQRVEVAGYAVLFLKGEIQF